MGFLKDIWRPAIVGRPMAEIIAAGNFDGAPIHWLPPMLPNGFLADPFGLWRDDRLYLFVERFSYRERHGTIELLVYDRALQLLARREVLREPWHLSYPFVFTADGEIWMLPEAHRSGRLTLYRATEFPYRWERSTTIALDHIAVDATPAFHDGLWWVFHTVANDKQSKTGQLHLAYAEKLSGPWRPHPANPVRLDQASARPGGTPIVVAGKLLLPVQDCTRTYGGGVRMLTIVRLSPTLFAAETGSPLQPPAGIAPFDKGMHTLSAAGDVTLIDVKRRRLAIEGLATEARREVGTLLARF